MWLAFSAKALITFESVSKLLFMKAPSYNYFPSVPALVAFSLPARSAIISWPVYWVSSVVFTRMRVFDMRG